MESPPDPEPKKDRRLCMRVTYTIELDQDDWARAYGVSGDDAIEKDIKNYIFNNIRSSSPFRQGDEIPVKIRCAD